LVDAMQLLAGNGMKLDRKNVLCFLTLPQKNANKVWVSILWLWVMGSEVKWYVSLYYHMKEKNRARENRVIVNVLAWPKTRQVVAVCRAVMMWGEMTIEGQTCMCIYILFFLCVCLSIIFVKMKINLEIYFLVWIFIHIYFYFIHLCLPINFKIVKFKPFKYVCCVI